MVSACPLSSTHREGSDTGSRELTISAQGLGLLDLLEEVGFLVLARREALNLRLVNDSLDPLPLDSGIGLDQVLLAAVLLPYFPAQLSPDLSAAPPAIIKPSDIG